MYRLASIATHVDAERAPYGAVNSIIPPMRFGPRLSESARLPPCWAVDSQTERKQTTWSTTPDATASAASITGPSWPPVSPVPRCQRVRRPSASWSWVEPAPLNPGPPPAAPGYDATPSMSSGLSPASSIARRHASTVRARPERPSRRPICETPIPLTTALPPSGFAARVTAPPARRPGSSSRPIPRTARQPPCRCARPTGRSRRRWWSDEPSGRRRVRRWRPRTAG